MSIRNKLLEEILVATGGSSLNMPVSPDDGPIYSAQGSAWVNSISTSTSNVYSWDEDVTATDPGPQKLKIDNADESLATNIYINETTLSGGSIESIGNNIVIGDLIRIQQYGATGNFITCSVSALPTDHGDWWTVPVTVLENAGGFVDSVNVSLDYWATGSRVDKVTIDRMANTEYMNASPTTGVEYNSLYDPNPVTETTTEVSGIALISAGGNQFAVFSRVSATALVGSPDVRVSRSSTFPGVTGSAEMVFWYDSVTETIHIQADLNGGGKTLDVLQVISAFDKLVLV